MIVVHGAVEEVVGVLAEVLTDATYPADRVEAERARVAERISIARSQPGIIARTALAARRYGAHPYAEQLPATELVDAVRSQALRKLTRARVPRLGSVPPASLSPFQWSASASHCQRMTSGSVSGVSS